MANTPVSAFDVALQQQAGFLFEVSFDNPSHDPLFLDEPVPLGKDQAPNAARALAAAIGNCLTASLAFCMQKGKAPVQGLKARVHVEIVRNEQGRLRIGQVGVDIDAPKDVDATALEKCLPLFEDFCTVTASIRRGIDVDVRVHR